MKEAQCKYKVKYSSVEINLYIEKLQTQIRQCGRKLELFAL